jgi:protein-disulfide isomerase
MKNIVALAAVGALCFLYSEPGFSQSGKELNELRREIEALKAGQTAIQKDLAEIKSLLIIQAKQAAAAAPTQPQGPTADNPTIVSIDGGAIKGDKNAKVTLVEFTDYQCPFCSRHFRDTMPQIDNDYVKTGKIRYVLREFPLEAIHPLAFKAAEAANCSGEQGRYWEMHHRLFANQNALAAQQLLGHAEAVGLDAGKFKTCLDSGKYAAKVRKDLAEAQRAGVTGTPTFFVGLSDPRDSEIKAVRKIVGAQNYAAFKAAIDTLLTEQ